MTNYPGQPNVINKGPSLRKREAEESVSEQCHVEKTKLAMAGSEDGRRP